MNFFLALFFCVAFSFHNFAQDSIVWGGYTKYDGETFQILNSNEHFYTLRNKKKFIFNSSYISKFSGFNQVYNEKIKRKTGNSNGIIEHFDIINGVPTLFLSDVFQGKKIIYIQQLNKLGKPNGPIRELAIFDMPNSWFNKGSLSISISENKKFILTEYQYDDSKSKKLNLKFQLFTNEFKLINNGKLTYENLENELTTRERKVLTNGKVFQLTKKSLFSNGFFGKKYSGIDDIKLEEIKGDSVNEIILKKTFSEFSDLKITSSNDILNLVGLYTKPSSSYQIEGMYYLNYNSKSNEIIAEGTSKFKTEFITQNWSERSRNRAIERESKGKDSPALYDYYIKDVVTLPDSSLLFLMEQYYVTTLTYTDPKTGYVSYRYIYNYNDIIIGKILANNQIDWMQLIPKKQVTENDEGYFSSFSYFISNNKAVLYFNDSPKNYTKDGNYTSDTKLFNFSSTKKILAQIDVDLKTGNYNRFNTKYIKKRMEKCIPILFSNNNLTKEFILFLIKGRKENFGIIHY
jgi:hypothetical protein